MPSKCHRFNIGIVFFMQVFLIFPRGSVDMLALGLSIISRAIVYVSLSFIMGPPGRGYSEKPMLEPRPLFVNLSISPDLCSLTIPTGQFLTRLRLHRRTSFRGRIPNAAWDSPRIIDPELMGRPLGSSRRRVAEKRMFTFSIWILPGLSVA
jgi:hypothetical protein